MFGSDIQLIVLFLCCATGIKKMTKVVVLVEGRAKKLFIAGNDVASLRLSFRDLCLNDPVLRGRVKTHYPTFYGCNEDDVELEDDDILMEGQRMRVFFAAFAAEVSRKSTLHQI